MFSAILPDLEYEAAHEARNTAKHRTRLVTWHGRGPRDESPGHSLGRLFQSSHEKGGNTEVSFFSEVVLYPGSLFSPDLRWVARCIRCNELLIRTLGWVNQPWADNKTKDWGTERHM